MQFAVPITVTEIDNKTDDKPYRKPEPVCPPELGHQICAAHYAENRYERQSLDHAEEDHHKCERDEHEVRDLRRDDPYSIYDRFEFDIPVGTGKMGTVGDCFDRHWVRMCEWEQSLNIIEQVLEKFPQDDKTDVQKAVPKRIKPGVGEIYARTETPRGELGYYIASKDGINPWRVKVRSPAFVNLSLLPIISRGYLMADLIIILGSVDIVLGEVDR